MSVSIPRDGTGDRRLRVCRHAPTGALVLVERIDFREGEIVARHVTGTQGLRVTHAMPAVLPMRECTRPTLVPRTPALVDQLWESGCAALGRKQGCAVTVRVKANGDREARLVEVTP